MFENLRPGARGEWGLTVAEEHTAVEWGSGGLKVFATPVMIGLMEGAAVRAVDPLLPEGYQTVGTHVDVAHLAATPVGGQVTAQAELTGVDGRKLSFRVQAHDRLGLIGEGTHERVVIEVARFLQRAQARR